MPGFDLLIIVTNTLGIPLMPCCYGAAFWDVMPYILVEKYRHVGITLAVYYERERRSAYKMKAVGSSETLLPLYVCETRQESCSSRVIFSVGHY
jgi:hypothetical protein